MGIWGLQTFIRTKCPKDCYENVKLAEIADLYRKETGKDPVLLIDISSCVIFFYKKEDINRVIAGGLKEFKENFEQFIDNCTQLGIKLKVVGDGKKPLYKYKWWKKGVTENAVELEKLYLNFDRGQINHLSCRRLLFGIIMNVLRLKCEYSRALYEADDVIGNYTKENDCFAVLSNDTDLLILNNIHYCLTPEDLNVTEMTAFNYNRNKIMKFLKIEPSQFPLFASVCIDRKFDCSDLQALYKRNNISSEKQFSEICELIKNFTSKEEFIHYYQLSEQDICCLEKRAQLYFGSRNQEGGLRPSGDNHWDKILCLARERHTTGEGHIKLLEIITDKVYFRTPTTENLEMPLPGTAFLPLRKRIYGILFFECPNSLVFVTEFSFKCPEGEKFMPYISTVIFPRRPHPGLLKLWSSEKSKTLKTMRKKVFYETISEKLSVAFMNSLNIPEEFVFPVLASFYLLSEIDNKVGRFEVKTILIQAVLANSLTSKEIRQLPEILDTDALNFMTWFTDLIEYFKFLSNICGEVFDTEKTNLVNFFDGKIFHFAYRKLKEGTKVSELLEPKMFTTFKTLISRVYILVDRCGSFSVNFVLREINGNKCYL